MEYKENLKKLVLEAKTRSKMSKTKLADRLDVSIPTYYKIEKGGEIDLNTFMILADLAGYDIRLIKKDSVVDW